MQIMMFLSDIMIPLLIFLIIGYGLLCRHNIYEEFIEGAKDGFETVIGIMPTLIGLMVAVGILRASGFLECFSNVCAIFTEKIGFPSELLPLAVVKMFSSSAATGLLLDIYKEYGTDSLLGRMASIMLGSTETTVYGVDIYGKKMLAELVKKLAAIKDIAWIRILYCYPEEIDDALIEVIKNEPKVCHYLDMPIQHASDSILKKMGRRTTKQELKDVINKLRENIPFKDC